MANNAKFEIEIYGNTAQFENSLKGVNSAMKGLKGEASQLKRELRLDPTNTNKMQQLQKNLQQQLQASKQKAAELRKEIASIDKSTPQGQEKWTKLQKQLKDNEIQAGYLEKEIGEVGDAIKRGNWNVDLETNKAEGKLSRLKNSFSGLREIAIGAFRQIGSSMVSALGNGLSGWINDAKATQKAMNALRNTMDFTGTGKDFDYLSKRMSQVAKDTNANTEDALKLGATFVGLGNDAKTAGNKVESIIKANQAFGGTGEQLKGVVQAYSQMSAAGKVTAENINQLTDNNTALGAALKKTVMDMNPALKKYGSFAQASEKGAVSVDMLDAALAKLGKAGGGSVETIDDAMASLNETISLALLPILDALTPPITAILNAIADRVPTIVGYISDLVAWFQFLFEAISANNTDRRLTTIWLNIIQIFKDVGKVIGSLLEDFGLLDKGATQNKESYEIVADAIDSMVKGMEIAIESMRIFIQKVTDSQGKIDVLKAAIISLGTAFAVFKGITFITTLVNGFGKFLIILGTVIEWVTTFGSAIAGLLTPVGWAVAAIAAIGAGLTYFFTKTKTGQKLWASFTKFLGDTMRNLGQFFSDTWKSISDSASGVVENIKGFFSGIGQWFSDLWSGIAENTQTVWSSVTEFFSTFVEGIKEIFTGVGEFFSGIWQGISDITMIIWNALTAFFQLWWTSLMAIISPFIPFFQSIWNLVTAIVNLAWQVIFGIVRMVFNNIINLWRGIIGFFQGLWNGITNLASAAWNAISGFASWAWNKIVGIWNRMVSWFSGVWNGAKNIASAAWNAITNLASAAWNRLVSVWNALASWFGGIWNSAKSIASSAWNAISSFAGQAWNRIVSVFSPLVGWFSGIFNSVRQVAASAFNVLGQWGANAANAITGAFSGLVGFFSGIFGAISDIASSALGWITDTINSVASAINGVAGKVKGFFGGSMVAELRQVNMAGAGFIGNSATASSTTTTNTFNIQANSMDITQLARAIKREIDNGRA